MSIYAWGLSKHAQAGHGDKTGKVIIPTKVYVKQLCGNIIDVSVGGLYTAVITDKNVLITFGCGKYGRLGSGSEEDQSSLCKVTIDGEPLISLSCGLWHGAALHKDGKFSMWGHKKACGSGSKIHSLVPHAFIYLEHCIGISCGNNYTLAWTAEGQAYSWGSNLHGVLGHGNKEEYETPKLIEALKDMKIVSMDAGFAHCGAVTEDGCVFMWGQAKFGALGLGTDKMKKDDFLSPQLVYNLENIKTISCNVGENHGHTLALTNSGCVYSVGDGYKGKLGLGDQNSVSSFQMISQEHFSNQVIKQIAAGGIHSSALSEEGIVFTWGCGSDGRLGHPDAEGHRYLFRSDVPRVVETLKYEKIKVISSSYYHMAALSEPDDNG